MIKYIITFLILLLASAGWASPAPTIESVQITSKGSANVGSTYVAIPVSCAVGDILLAIVATDGGREIVPVASEVSLWNLIDTTKSPSSTPSLGTYWKPYYETDLDSFGFTTITSYGIENYVATISRISGADTTDPINFHTWRSAASGTTIPTTGDTTRADSCRVLVIGAVDDDDDPYSGPGGWNEEINAQSGTGYGTNGLMAYSLIFADSGTFTDSQACHQNASEQSIGVQMAIKPFIPPEDPPDSSIIGDSSETSDSYYNTHDTIVGSWFVSPMSGQIDSAKAFIYNYNDAGKYWRIYVYSYPGKSLLGASDSTSGNALSTWKTFNFSVKPEVVENDSVFLGITSEGNSVISVIFEEDKAGDTIFRDPETFGSAPSTFTPTDTLVGSHVLIAAYLSEVTGGGGQVMFIKEDL